MLPDDSELLSQRWRIVTCSIVGKTHHCWHTYIGPTMGQPLHTNDIIYCCNQQLHTNGIFRKVGPTMAQYNFSCLLFGITNTNLGDRVKL